MILRPAPPQPATAYLSFKLSIDDICSEPQTPFPIVHFNTKFASLPSASNLKTKGSLAGNEMGVVWAVLTMPFRTVSMGSLLW